MRPTTRTPPRTSATAHREEGVPPAPPGVRARGGPLPAGWLVLLATPIAVSANAPVLILPDIAADVGVRTSTAVWLVSVFAWAMALGTPLMAGLLRRWGIRAALRTGAVLATAGTLTVLLSPWLPLLLAGRAAQALGGTALTAVAMNLAGTVRRMGAITAGFALWGAVGPLAGRLIGGTVSWRPALALSALGLLAVPAVAAYLRDAPGRGRAAPGEGPVAGERFDARGAALVALLVTGLVLLPRHPLPALTVVAGCGALLRPHVRARPAGFLPAALLRAPVFLGASGLIAALSTAYFALLFAVPRLLDDRTGWGEGSVAAAQMIALLVGGAGSFALAALSGRLGRRRLLAVLVVLGLAGPALTIVPGWAPSLVVVPALAVAASSGGLSTLGVLASRAAPPDLRPAAIGLLNLCFQLGGAFGPAIALITVG